MNFKLSPLLAVIALCGAPLIAHATVFQFNASLNNTNEVGVVSAATATGVALLSYNDMGTLALGDDTYNFSMAVSGLTGGAVAGTAASAFHIHGSATTAESSTVRVSLDASPFVSLNTGNTLLVLGSGVAAPSFGATAASGTNAGHPAMSFLSMLQGGLAYVNVHTALNPGGAIRGQLVAVTAVPEPSTYALLLGGLGLIGLVAKRRRRG